VFGSVARKKEARISAENSGLYLKPVWEFKEYKDIFPLRSMKLSFIPKRCWWNPGKVIDFKINRKGKIKSNF